MRTVGHARHGFAGHRDAALRTRATTAKSSSTPSVPCAEVRSRLVTVTCWACRPDRIAWSGPRTVIHARALLPCAIHSVGSNCSGPEKLPSGIEVAVASSPGAVTGRWLRDGGCATRSKRSIRGYCGWWLVAVASRDFISARYSSRSSKVAGWWLFRSQVSYEMTCLPPGSGLVQRSPSPWMFTTA